MVKWIKSYVCAACGYSFVWTDEDPSDPGWMTCTKCGRPASVFLGGRRIVTDGK